MKWKYGQVDHSCSWWIYVLLQIIMFDVCLVWSACSHCVVGWAAMYGVVEVSEVFNLLPMTDENIQVAVLRAEGLIPPVSRASNRDEEYEMNISQHEMARSETATISLESVDLAGRLRGGLSRAENFDSESPMFLMCLLAVVIVYVVLRKIKSLQLTQGKRN